MMRRVSSALVFLGTLSLALGACSDDGGNGMGPDSSVPMPDDGGATDAAIDAPPALERAGSIAVLDLALTNDITPPPPNPIRGAMVHIKYKDLTEPDVEPVFDERMGEAQEGCAVWVYDVGTSMPQPGVDEGAVTIMGAESPIGTCTFDGTEYRCSTGGGTLMGAMTGVIPDVANGTADINLFYPGFQGQDLRGSRIMLSGFVNDQNNGTFDVLSQGGGTSITIANPNAVTETLVNDATYTVYTGAGPTRAGRPFLDGDTATVSITKAAGDIVPEINMDLAPSGLGLTLDTASNLLHELPVDPVAEASFSCRAAMGGTCGVAVPPVFGQVVTGWTTDGDISASPMPDYMPDPVGTWARFECRSLSDDPVVIPEAAIQALVDTGATRIKTSMWRVSMSIDLQPFTDVFVGHGLVGYTDVPAAP